MDLDAAITGRRSIRKFTAAPVADKDLETLVDAARNAPSWANTQCVRYVVVRDPAVRKALVACMSERNPAKQAVEQAPVTVAFVAKLGLAGHKAGKPVDDKDWYMFDAGLAVQNFCLKAHAMGLGTVIVGFFDYRKAGELLGVPQGWELVAFTPVGVPEGGASAPARLGLNELVHAGRFRA